MKIIIDARESGTSTGRYVDKLVENLHKLKTDLDFTVLTKPSRVDYMGIIAPKFEIIPSNFKEFTFAEQTGLGRQLNYLKPDLVHFAMTQQPAFYKGSVVTTIHDLTTARFKNPSKNSVLFNSKQVVYRWLIKRVARKSKKIITPSHFVKNDVAQYADIQPDKITAIHEAADTITEHAELFKPLVDKHFIMYLGRPLPHKNLDRLVEAFKLLQAKYPAHKLVLAGKKDVLYQRMEEKIRTEGIQNVVFTGFVSEGQLRWLYENTAAYIFPSLSEGFGLPGLEAMVHGAPVLSSNATCLPEIYGQAAHYFDPMDINDMATKISEVLEDKKLRNKLIENGKKQAAKYSWRQMAEQTLEVYKEALKA